MEGFILAAGVGSRLRPLTDRTPKALVEVQGVPMIDRVMARLVEAGARRVVVNVHHLADQVEVHLKGRDWGVPVAVSDERACLLDTGGALRHAAHLFSGSEPVLVHNVDVLSRIGLDGLAAAHARSRNLVTLCVADRPSARRLVFDGDLLAGREGEVPPREGLRPLAFSGISMVSPRLFALLPDTDGPFPIIPCYTALAQAHRIGAFVHAAADWLDVGRPETLQQAQQWNLSSTK